MDYNERNQLYRKLYEYEHEWRSQFDSLLGTPLTVATALTVALHVLTQRMEIRAFRGYDLAHFVAYFAAAVHLLALFCLSVAWLWRKYPYINPPPVLEVDYLKLENKYKSKDVAEQRFDKNLNTQVRSMTREIAELNKLRGKWMHTGSVLLCVSLAAIIVLGMIQSSHSGDDTSLYAADEREKSEDPGKGSGNQQDDADLESDDWTDPMKRERKEDEGGKPING